MRPCSSSIASPPGARRPTTASSVAPIRVILDFGHARIAYRTAGGAPHIATCGPNFARGPDEITDEPLLRDVRDPAGNAPEGGGCRGRPQHLSASRLGAGRYHHRCPNSPAEIRGCLPGRNSLYLLYYHPNEQSFGGLRVDFEYDESVPGTSRSCELSSASDDGKGDRDRPNVRLSSGAEDVVGRGQD